MTDRVIDQAFFGWSTEHGQQHMLAHTFDKTAEATRWQHQLQGHIRLYPMPNADLPPAALSYFTYTDGTAAVLRRVNVGVTTGRNNSHALIGPATLLTTRAALGLFLRPDWPTEPPDPPLSRVSIQAVANCVKTVDDHLLPVLAAHQGHVVAVLASLLADRHAPVSIIGCPDDLHAAMVWALVEVAERTGIAPILTSFSTYEDRHDVAVEGLPHVVFLPVQPYERGEVDRTVVDLNRPLVPGPHVEEAQRLFQRLVNRTLTMKEQPVPVSERRRAAPPPQRQKPLEVTLVEALRDATSLRDFESVLAQIHQARVPRRALRSALGPGLLDETANRIEVDYREELLGQLLAAAYGPELQDLTMPDGQKHAVQVIRNADSDQLAIMIASANPAASVAVRDALIDRWLPRAARRRRPASVAVLARRLRTMRRARYLPVTAAAAVLAILGAAFLGGLLVGRSGGDGGGAAAAAPPPAESVPAESAPAARGTQDGRIVGGYAVIDDVDPEAAMVMAFAQSEDNKVRPQGPCLATSASNTWFCPGRALATGESPTLVAYRIPKKDADNVLEVQEPRAPAADWGAAHKVR